MEKPFRYRGLFIVTKRLSFVLCQFFPGLIKSSKLFADLGFFFTQFDTFSNIRCHLRRGHQSINLGIALFQSGNLILRLFQGILPFSFFGL